MPKRLFDVVVTVAVAPLAAVVVAIFGALLAVELRGSPFFVQERVGLHGKPFRLYKLRTMRHAKAGEEKPYLVENWKTFVFDPPGEGNPRTTRIGRFARRTSIDELPNLVNVLKGEMSLVGPRPELPEIVAQYPEVYHRRHQVRPGIAGLAQVSGRSDLTYDETAIYDLAYVDSHSLWTDVQILGKTLVAVFSGRGAR